MVPSSNNMNKLKFQRFTCFYSVTSRKLNLKAVIQHFMPSSKTPIPKHKISHIIQKMYETHLAIMAS